MLTYRTASIYLVILAIAVFLLMILDVQFAWLLLPLGISYVYLLAMGSAKICSGFYIDVFCRGNSEEKAVALTFDDGPDEKLTPRILELLDKHEVTATFFVIGHKAEDNPALLKEIISRGHSIGNHSYSHSTWFDLFGRKKMEQDLLNAEEEIVRVTGTKPVFFRPPYGVTTPVLAKVVKKLGYKTVGWSVRSLDTVLKDKEKLIERITDRLHPGAVILLHDDREITGEVLEDVIMKIKNEGYRVVALQEMI
jgi:peptidoglycan/xylan/chitin deacetylase (PgdA/CDA1 family)